jgi:tetratricopeptide (TPR) repeat protein
MTTPRADRLRRQPSLPGAAPALKALAAALLAAGLAACSGPRTLPGDDAPTLKTLAGREAPLPATGRLPTNEAQALRAWRALLAAQPDAKQRAQALRRLGDLEMDRTDASMASADAPANADYKAAITGYQDYLKAYPKDPGNDRVLYQLARAHEQGGDLDQALQSLDRLVQDFPATRYADEAQFRRGELLFTARQYPAAEAAYATVLASNTAGPFRDRALYMRGWSQFKQGKLAPALGSFLAVLDGKLAGRDDALPLEELPDLSRADRELVEDSFRVTSLALENLQGASSIAPLVSTPERASYQVRIYQQLAALYLKQDRPKDAADTLHTFARLQPLHAMAPVLQEQVIAIHTEAGFDQQALAAKQDFVARYGAQADFRRANPVAWSQAQPLVKTHLAELARHFHAAAQKSHQRTDVQQAVAGYQALLQAFPGEPEAAENHFLLAELLFEDQRFADAAAAYEKTAYGYPTHARSADAGYAALLALAAQGKAGPLSADDQAGLQRDGVASALRFAHDFPADARTPPVLAHAANTLVQLRDTPRAQQVAEQLLNLQPPAPDEQRRVALTVLATTTFETGNFAVAERHTAAALALTAPNAPGRGALSDRLAAAIYKQGEQARSAGQAREAATLFARVAEAAPQSPIRVAAQFDAAAQLIVLKDWPAATRLLEDFRQRYPHDALQAQVPSRLALAYSEQGQWTPAAQEFERIAQAETDAERSRNAWWQAAESRDKAQATPGASGAARSAAAKAWERTLQTPGLPLPLATEARAKLAALAKADGNSARELAWQRELLAAERGGGEARTARTRSLSGQAALALAAPEFEAYRKIALVEPLPKSLALKKAKLEDVLKAYARAAEDGQAEVVTAATFHTAALYQDFGKALMDSQRPKKLKPAELEQYNVMLEEQAYPFEEKAMEIHELNAQRSAEGLYDDWVRQSFAALRTLRPVRYGKTERSDAATSPAAELNRQAIALRQKGQFKAAREAWQQALASSPDYAPAVLNLGVLLDLYLAEPAAALAQYERYLALTPAGDPQVSKWVAELKNRKPAARKES